MTSTEHSSGESNVRSYESIIETMADGVFVLDRDGTIIFVNRAIESFLDTNRDELIGGSFESLTDTNLFDKATYERFTNAVQTIRAGGAKERRLTLETAQSQVVEVRLTARERDETSTEIVGTVRDITEREQALSTIQRQQRAIYQLYHIDTTPELTVTEKIEHALEIGCEFLDLPIGFVASIEEQMHRLEYVVGSDEFEPGSSRPLESSYCRFTMRRDDPVAIRDAEADLGTGESVYAQTGVRCYIGTKIPVGGDVYGTFCFAARDARSRSFSESEREFVRLLGLWAGYNIERQRFESILHGLHEVSQELLLAESKTELAQLAVDSASELFELPIVSCWRYDMATDTLKPLAETERARRTIGETPTIKREQTLAWDSFDSEAVRVYQNLADDQQTYHWTGALESAVHIPLGKQGLLICGSATPRSVGKLDTESFQLLGDLLRDGLISIDQREALMERGEALQRQNEQLEEFAHVVAHDLRNPLAGAVGFLEIARETNDEQHFDRIETSLARMGELIDQLLAIARGSRQAAAPRELSLDEVVSEAWSYIDTCGAILSVSDDLGHIYADEIRLLQLLGNLFRNSVEHGGTTTTVEVGQLPSGAGFYVEDDGSGLPDGAREDILTLGRTASATGTGIGLESVTDIIDAHGWELTIPETETGVRFEVLTNRRARAEG